MSASAQAVTIEILDKEYVVSCPPGEEDALVESARMLDQRLRQIRHGGKVLGTERMAVITALNVIHEFNQHKRAESERATRRESEVRHIEEKIEAEVDRLRRR